MATVGWAYEDARPCSSAFIQISKLLLVAMLLLFCLSSCDTIQKRPVGYFRLGKVKDYLAPETYLENYRLLLRRDEGGLYVMSTECTYDLSPLKPKKTDQGIVFVSEVTTSKHDINGKVLSGPATAPQPYYELLIDSATIGTPRDTLYVRVGVEKPQSWRLKIPNELLQ